MNNNNTKQKFHLRVKTKLEALQEVLQWYEELISPRLPEQTGRQCEVALVEAFTNAVRHAHQDLPSNTPIDLEVELYPNCLEMRVWDQGKPFDLQAQLQANQDNVTSLDKEGGRGLQFIKKLTDDLQYLSNLDYRNCLIIKKRYSQTSNIA
ncbi:MAG: ATP-binding protein [Xenococcaceae cyanobacterium MO_207.B15]|nr:ATP-binding protein [Xenococcaceae cyanobacterium MO_207.B15]